MKTAIVTGVTGQDGSYLARLLLQRGYRVIGGARRTSGDATAPARLVRLGIERDVELVPFDLSDQGSMRRMLERFEPDEVYNLAAQSFVPVSFEQPVATSDVTGLGVVRLLESIRDVNPEIRFYQASSSEMFGQSPGGLLGERSQFHPRSPYGVAKLYAHWATINFREAYGMHASSGILFNHESPLRGEMFITRKVTRAVARIAAGTQKTLALGNLDAVRDWGYAGEYVDAMWRMLQQSQPDDYVIATGTGHSVRDLVELAFAIADLDWRDHVISDPSLQRPADVDALVGDAGKARRVLGWQPQTTFRELVAMMLHADMEDVARLQRGSELAPAP